MVSLRPARIAALESSRISVDDLERLKSQLSNVLVSLMALGKGSSHDEINVTLGQAQTLSSLLGKYCFKLSSSNDLVCRFQRVMLERASLDLDALIDLKRDQLTPF